MNELFLPGDAPGDFTAEERKARTELIASFATFLTQQMVEAIGGTDLRWSDTVYSAAMAITAVGEMALVLSQHQKGGGDVLTTESVSAHIDALIDKARKTKVHAIKMDSMEEMDAFMAGQEKGLH
jgi:hypothetical protein